MEHTTLAVAAKRFEGASGLWVLKIRTLLQISFVFEIHEAERLDEIKSNSCNSFTSLHKCDKITIVIKPTIVFRNMKKHIVVKEHRIVTGRD